MDIHQKYYQTPGHTIAAGAALSFLTAAAVGMRFWTRRRQNQPLKMDDWLVVPAAVRYSYTVHLRAK